MARYLLERGEQKRPETAPRAVGPRDGPLLEQVREERLRQVLRVVRVRHTPSDVGIER